MNLTINEEFLEEFCENCGACCKNLVLFDKIEIFLSSGKIVTTKICKYYCLTGHNCSIYAKKPKSCGKWTCGVVDRLREML